MRYHDLASWFAAKSWRWRATHAFVGASAGFFGQEPGAFGTALFYLWHERRQAKKAGNWQNKNTLDFLAACLGACAGYALRKLL